MGCCTPVTETHKLDTVEHIENKISVQPKIQYISVEQYIEGEENKTLK